MKILHIVSGDLWAGAEAQALLLITHLAVDPAAHVHVVLLNEGELARCLREAGIAVTVLDESKLSAAAVLWHLWLIARRFKPQVVHTHRIKENILGSISAWLAGVTVCIRTAHGLDEHPPRGLRNWHRQLLRRVDVWCCRFLQQAVVAVSEDLGTRLRQLLPGCPVYVIPNGVDPAALRECVAAATPVQWPAHYRHVGIAGRLVPVKRVDLFLRTAAELRDRQPDLWRFHVLGDGPLADQMHSLADQLGLRGQVCFHGQVSPLAPSLQALDVLVLCSDHEGMPMVALEAMALGVPVVGHAVGGLCELLPRECLVHDQVPRAYADSIESVARSAARPVTALPVDYTARQNAARVNRLYQELVISR